MRTLIVLTLLAAVALLPAAAAGPDTFPVCKDKSATVPGVTAVYVNFDCYDDIYVCEVGQPSRNCERLVTVGLE
jgi:hypothetical protein